MMITVMPAVALLSLAVTMWQRSTHFKSLAHAHFRASLSATWGCQRRPYRQARLHREQERYHWRLYQKYADAAKHPWRTVEPDGAEPTRPDETANRSLLSGQIPDITRLFRTATPESKR